MREGVLEAYGTVPVTKLILKRKKELRSLLYTVDSSRPHISLSRS
jgi:hypothetical protein